MTSADHGRWWKQAKWRAFGAIGFAYLLLVLAMSLSFLTLPSVAEEFDVTLKAVGWVVITESLLIAALLLPMGGLADSFGRKKVLAVGTAVMGTGAALTGLAPSFALVIAARVVMAIGSTLFQSVSTGMLIAAFPPEERGVAMGSQTAAVATGSAAAPLFGGVALQVLDWDTLFLLLAIPVGLSLLVIRVLIDDDLVEPEPDAQQTDGGRRFDRVGAALSALAIAAMVLTVNNPFDQPWLSSTVLASAALSVCLVAAFVRWELSVERPMLELRLFAISVFRKAVTIRVLGFTASAAYALMLPIYLLTVREVSAAMAGLVISILPMGMGISASVTGRIYDRVGPRAPSVLGLTLQVGTTTAFAFSDESTPLLLIGVFAFLSGAGMALWNVSNNSAMMGAIPPASLAVGGAFSNVTRTVGSAFGQALTTAMVAGVMVSKGFDIPLGDLSDTAGAAGAFIDGWQVAFLGAAGLSAFTLIFAVMQPNDPTDQR
ncbi:MAG: MFS transporter [Acidimicrobiales bacterium]